MAGMIKGPALFLAQFADAMNRVWDDEQAEVPMRQRERFSFLLMGSGLMKQRKSETVGNTDHFITLSVLMCE